MFRTLSFSLLAALGGLCLGSCSSQPAAGAGETVRDAAATDRATVSRVDSLNGVPGHAFGEPLAAFAGAIPLAVDELPGLTGIRLPAGNPGQVPWFAKHEAEVPTVFYYFRDGKFAAFRAVAESAAGQAALEQEMKFLFGPGKQSGDHLEWVGARAWAVLSTSYLNGRPIRQLDINSSALQAEQEKKQQAQLRADNAGN